MSDAAESTSLPSRRRLVLLLLVAIPILVWARSRPAASSGTLGIVLPYLTEGALAMLLGIALGVATSFLARFLLFGMLLGLVVSQYLAYLGQEPLVEFGHFLRRCVWNFEANATGGTIVRHKLPALACGLLGYAIGRKQ